jgi:hypothetical protein
MKSKLIDFSKVLGAGFFSLSVMLLISHCGNTATTTKSLVQIERLARPAVNEGLVLTNASLNAYNSIPPNVDLLYASVPAVGIVIGEVQTVLGLIKTFAGTNAPAFATVAGGFVPDVMRINTEASIPPGSFAYNGDSGLVGGSIPILTGGRKLEDGVMNITLSYLFTGNPGSNVPATFNTTAVNPATSYSDKLTYDQGSTCTQSSTANGPTIVSGSSQAPGHYCLFGQTARYGTASFPYLARPSGSY